MNRVTVYYFTGYNIDTDKQTVSRRPATLDMIRRANGEPLVETALVVDASELDGNGFARLP